MGILSEYLKELGESTTRCLGKRVSGARCKGLRGPRPLSSSGRQKGGQRRGGVTGGERAEVRSGM